MARRTGFTVSRFLIRWAVALVLVFATFNPTNLSYYHWIVAWSSEYLPLKAVAGLALLILYLIFLRATWRSIGPIGVGLAVAFLAALVWLLTEVGIIDLRSPGVPTYILLVAFATIMAVGISWSHIQRRVSGEAQVDELDT